MIHTKEPLLDSSAELLRRAESVVVFTGAGMSKESGIPTFRDALEGLWKNSPQKWLWSAFHAPFGNSSSMTYHGSALRSDCPALKQTLSLIC